MRLCRAPLRSLTTLLALAIVSCKSSTSAPPLDPINTDSWADFVARDIVAVTMKVRADLTNGSYSGTQVAGSSGTATVSGTVSFQSGVSCGSSCVGSTNNTSLTIAFNGFVTQTATNTTTTISGTITFQDTEWSQQSGLSYSSGGSLCVGATGNVSYRMVGTDAAGQFGVNDVITSLSSCGSTITQSGTLTTSSGTFSF